MQLHRSVLDWQKISIEHPQSTGWLYLHVPRAGEIGHTAASLLVGGAYSSSTCSCSSASIIVSMYLLPMHFCIRILLSGLYTSVYYAYLIMTSWLVGWFAGQGKKGVCVGKIVNCGPVVGSIISCDGIYMYTMYAYIYYLVGQPLWCGSKVFN